MSETASKAWTLMAGAGNRFVMREFRGATPSAELLAEAQALSEREHVDGVVYVGPGQATPAGAADVRMVVVNADGSRPEACGNGLRCAAVFAVERGLARGPELRIATDSGLRAVELLPDGTVRAELGRATVTAFEVVLGGRARQVFDVRVGNPHGVLFAEPGDTLTLADVAAALRSSKRFEGGVNVEVARRTAPGRYCVEVDERGVGPTKACGTGASAVAAAAWARGEAARDTELSMQFSGGELHVACREDGELLLRGAVERLARRGTR